jgi:alpha-tubulin suppressor-like RCC1 family protein
VTGISDATAIAVSADHVCAALRGGSIECWGANASGQLGDGTTHYSASPVRVRGASAPAELAAGPADTCALLSDGAMRCWGFNNNGQLGNRRRNSSPWPVNVVGTPGVVWGSSDRSKATVTDRGLATGRAVGNTTITATTAGFINDNAVLMVK